MAPVAVEPPLRRQVGQLLVVLDLGVLEALDQADVSAVDVIARTLDGDGEVTVVRAERGPADLHVPVEDHPGRAPVVDGVREDVDVHEQGVGLAGEQRAPFAIGILQPERRLARIVASAKEVEVELESERRVAFAGRHRAFDAEAALLDADARLPVTAELTFGRRYLRRAEGVVPIRIHPLEVVNGIHHHEAVHLQPWPGLRLHLYPWRGCPTLCVG